MNSASIAGAALPRTRTPAALPLRAADGALPYAVTTTSSNCALSSCITTFIVLPVMARVWDL